MTTPKRPISYSYSTLRYIHDLVTGEFVNIGVAIYFPSLNLVDAKFRTTTSRISAFFPGSKAELIRKELKALDKKFNAHSSLHSPKLNFEGKPDFETLLNTYLVKDDSSIQWSPIQSGIATRVDSTLEHLYDRLVMRHEKQTNERKTEQDIWRNFSKNLPRNSVYSSIQSKTIAANDGEVEFEHALKNAIWHCFQPISFDLTSSAYINEKATRWLGQCINIEDTPEEFKLYFLLAKPSEDKLLEEYERAVRILKKIPFEAEIVEEEKFDELGKEITAMFISHMDSTHFTIQ